MVGISYAQEGTSTIEGLYSIEVYTFGLSAYNSTMYHNQPIYHNYSQAMMRRLLGPSVASVIGVYDVFTLNGQVLVLYYKYGKCCAAFLMPTTVQ